MTSSLFTHAILSTGHTDATVGTVQRGDLIIGQDASATWKRKALGAANTYLRSDFTDADWSTITLATNTTGDYAASITGGAGIDSTGATSGENIAHTLSFDPTEIDAAIWSDGTNASNVWTFDVSGTDHTMTAASGTMTFSDTVSATILTDGTTSITGGDYTGVGNITGSDVDIEAGAGNFNTTGTIDSGSITSSGSFTMAGLLTNTLAATDTTGMHIDGATNDLTTDATNYIQRLTRDIAISSNNALASYGSSIVLNNAKNFTGSTAASRLLETYGDFIDVTITGTHGGNAGAGLTENNYAGFNKLTRSGTVQGTASPVFNNYGSYNEVVDSMSWNTANVVTIKDYGSYNEVTQSGTEDAGDMRKTGYAVYAKATGSADGTSTLYGLFIDSVSGADNNWGIFDNSGADGAISGNLSVGKSTAPNVTLDVAGAITTTGDLHINRTGTNDATIQFDGDGGSTGKIIYESDQDRFDLENADILTAGDATFNELTLTTATQDFLFTSRANTLAIQSQATGMSNTLELYNKDGDNTDTTQILLYSLGTPGSVGNRERLIIRKVSNVAEIFTDKAGTGNFRALKLFVSGQPDQLVLETSGQVSFLQGDNVILGQEGLSATLVIGADQGDDPGDRWRQTVNLDGKFDFSNDISSKGTFIDHVILTPADPVTDSTFDIKGNLIANTAVIGASGTTLDVEADGDTFWVGAGTGVPYGHMYVDGTQSIIVALTLNTPTEVEDDGTTSAEDGWLAGDLNLFTFAPDSNSHHLNITKAGVYHITWNLSFKMVTGAANTQIHAGLTVDSTTFVRNKCEAHRTISNNVDVGNMAGTCIIDLPNGNEELSLWIENTTNSNNADVVHGSLTAVMIGGT